MGERNVSLMSFVCIVRERYLRRADHLSGGVLPSVVFLSVIWKPWQGGSLGLVGLADHEKKEVAAGNYLRLGKMWFFVGCLERVSKQCIELLCSWPSCGAQIGNAPEHENKALYKSDRHVERRPKLFPWILCPRITHSLYNYFQTLVSIPEFTGLIYRNLLVCVHLWGKTMNKEIYIDILRHVRDAQNKITKNAEPTVGFYFTTMLQHTGRFWSRIS